jgi:hypothetical protein
VNYSDGSDRDNDAYDYRGYLDWIITTTESAIEVQIAQTP